MSIFTVPDHNPDVPLASLKDGPSYTMHEAQIDYEAFGGNPALKAASDALKFGRETYNADNEYRGAQDGEDRAATHDRKVRERVEGSQRAFEQRIGAAMTSLRAEYQRVERDLAEKAGLKADPTLTNAIVGTLQGMSLPERIAAISQMIEDGDNAVLATIIEQSTFLTGVPKEVRDNIKTRVLTKVDPAGLRLRDGLLNAMMKTEAAGNDSAGMFAKLMAGTEPGAWKVRAQQAAARNMSVNAGQR